jgi:hypothetical protein
MHKLSAWEVPFDSEAGCGNCQGKVPFSAQILIQKDDSPPPRWDFPGIDRFLPTYLKSLDSSMKKYTIGVN